MGFSNQKNLSLDRKGCSQLGLDYRILRGEEMYADPEYPHKLKEFSQRINPKAPHVVEESKKWAPRKSQFKPFDVHFCAEGEALPPERVKAKNSVQAIRAALLLLGSSTLEIESIRVEEVVLHAEVM